MEEVGNHFGGEVPDLLSRESQIDARIRTARDVDDGTRVWTKAAAIWQTAWGGMFFPSPILQQPSQLESACGFGTQQRCDSSRPSVVRASPDSPLPSLRIFAVRIRLLEPQGAAVQREGGGGFSSRNLHRGRGDHLQAILHLGHSAP